jgi:1-deoxy-D-xylulose-5-phosphate synthase
MYSQQQVKQQHSLLESINFPADLRMVNVGDLPLVCDELRQETISTVAKTGGHLGAGLGVVELTVALHYVFNTPEDLLIWDIGHQAYPHKILTGRKHLMHTLRTAGGLSGFLKRSESEYDVFGAGHSSTSISAALGMAVARDLRQQDKHVVAVIGDGALTAGMVYEAMNNAGHLRSKMIVILNDNEMSIAPNVGAISKYLSKLISSKPFLSVRQLAKQVLHKMPQHFELLAKKTSQYAKDLIVGGNFFEEMGFHYVGPIDGHDVEDLVTILTVLKADESIKRPILMHVKTQKGKGFEPNFSCKESYHAVGKFDPNTKLQVVARDSSIPTYTKIVGQTLSELANTDDKIVAITAAMPSGTGVDVFAKHHPERAFDVGIAEQHAVTFAAGLASEGMKPFVAIYSTFMQRAYDQVVHDVAIQKLPVRFLLDRAGLVGADGPTHAGAFDVAFMGCLPHMVIMSPADEAELVHMVATSLSINDVPSMIRYPRGEGVGVALPNSPQILDIGKGRVLQNGSDVAILSLGTRLAEVQKAAIILQQHGISVTVADARFAKPLDEKLICTLAHNHKIMLSIEEGSMCGFGAMVADVLLRDGCLDQGRLKFRSMHLPDCFIEHDTAYNMYEHAGLNASGITSMISQLLSA